MIPKRGSKKQSQTNNNNNNNNNMDIECGSQSSEPSLPAMIDTMNTMAMNDPPQSSSSNGKSDSSHSHTPSTTTSSKFRFPSRSPNLFKLIERQDWPLVRRCLQTSHGIKTCKKTDHSGLSVLGMCLGFHAPLDIIERVLQVDPKSSMVLDVFGAVPLHVACLNGASCEVVQYILDYDDCIAAYSVDDDQRIPLHHAVEYVCRPRAEEEQNSNSNSNSNNRDPNEDKNSTSTSLSSSSNPEEEEEDIQNMMEVIRALCTAAPEMVKFEDRHGDTPIDLCQLVKADSSGEDDPAYKRGDRVYRVLRETLIQVYRKEKHEWESKNRKGGKHGGGSGVQKDAGTAVTDVTGSLADTETDLSSAAASMSIGKNKNDQGTVASGAASAMNGSACTPMDASAATTTKRTKRKRFGLFGGKS